MSISPKRCGASLDQTKLRLSTSRGSRLASWLSWMRCVGKALPKRPRAVQVPSGPEAPALHEFTPLFVGGSWRSGTTVLHALICTSDKANDYIGECSYFSALVHALSIGLEAFDVHTKYYFASPGEVIAHHASILRGELHRIWCRLDKPAILSLKDPLLTPSFPLLARTLTEARFVVSVRDPLDTLSSRIDVFRRMNGGADPTVVQVRELCLQYVATYRAIADNLDAFEDRLCLIDYQALVEGDDSKLRAFGLPDIDRGSVWQSSITDVHEHAGNPWLTPLYGAALSAASIGRYRDRLPCDLEGLVMEICGDVWGDLGTLINRSAAA